MFWFVSVVILFRVVSITGVINVIESEWREGREAGRLEAQGGEVKEWGLEAQIRWSILTGLKAPGSWPACRTGSCHHHSQLTRG